MPLESRGREKLAFVVTCELLHMREPGQSVAYLTITIFAIKYLTSLLQVRLCSETEGGKLGLRVGHYDFIPATRNTSQRSNKLQTLVSSQSCKQLASQQTVLIDDPLTTKVFKQFRVAQLLTTIMKTESEQKVHRTSLKAMRFFVAELSRNSRLRLIRLPNIVMRRL